MHGTTWRRLATLGAIGILIVACGGDDDPDGDATEATTEADDPADDSDDSGETAETQDEPQDDTQDDAEAGPDATLVWDGEPIAVDAIRCDERSITDTPNGYSIEAHWDAGWLWTVWDQDDEEMASVLMQWNEDDAELSFHAPYWDPEVDVDGEVDFEVEQRSSGSVHLMPNKRDAEERMPDGALVEFDITCPAE